MICSKKYWYKIASGKSSCYATNEIRSWLYQWIYW